MSSAYKTLDDVNVAGQRVLVRIDLNVPMDQGRVTDATRIDRILPTIRELSQKGARVILLSHFGRPKGQVMPDASLKSLASVLAEHLGQPVAFVDDCIGPEVAKAVAVLKDGEILLLENTRFYAQEEKNDADFAKQLAANGDIYVNDAFSVSHRAHASTEGVAHYLPSYAGRAMEAELAALTRALEAPERPVMAIVGGAKVSTKLDLLGNLLNKVQILVIGGAMANTFLAAQGVAVGKSLYEKDLLDTAQDILAKAKASSCEIILPTDATIAKELRAHAPSRFVALNEVAEDDLILDIGPQSIARVKSALQGARTLVWNGPVGAFEFPPFNGGTHAIAVEVARLTQAGHLVSVAGGGDTVAALNASGVTNQVTYLSTAGGAFLEWLEGKILPGIEVLRQ